MANLDYITKSKLELMFQMEGGYVLDFTNASFTDFIQTAAGFDPYEKHGPGSKAQILRRIWNEEPMPVVARIVLNLLEYWSFRNQGGGGESTAAESALHDEIKAHFTSVATTATDAAGLEFLQKETLLTFPWVR